MEGYLKDPITPDESKGIDFCIKIMKKKYPFITGWRLIKDYRNWEGVLFIVLLIDPNRLSSYLDCPLYDNLSFSLKNYPPRDYNTLYYFIDSECLSYEERKEILDRMDEKIKTTYNTAIPDVFVKNYVSVSSEVTRGKTFKETLIISGFNVI